MGKHANKGDAKDDEKKPAARWNAKDTRILLEKFSMVKKQPEYRNTGGPIGLSTAGWNEVIEKMKKSKQCSNTYDRNQAQSKMSQLQKDYKINEWLLAKTGLGIDPVTQAFTADDETRAEIVKTKKEAAKFFKAPLANLDILEVLLGWVECLYFFWMWLSLYSLTLYLLPFHFPCCLLLGM